MALRLVLWFIAAGVAIFPTLYATPFLEWNFFPPVNNAGLFRDLFFVVVPISTLAISSVMDFMMRRARPLPPNALAVCLLVILLNFTGLVAGLIGFLAIAESSVLADGQLLRNAILICAVAVFSLLTEIGVSFAHQ